MTKQTRKQEREARFKRIAPKRTQKVLDDLRLLSNCSNKSAYSYTEAEVNKIFRTIEQELRIAKARFKGGKKNKKKFEL